MKVIIQCSGRKRSDAGRLRSAAGEDILFVAQPGLCPRDTQASVCYCRPDDPVEPGSETWREALVAYNFSGGNPRGLSAAADLYCPGVYRSLASAFGRENVFILSAGRLVADPFRLPYSRLQYHFFQSGTRLGPTAETGGRATEGLESPCQEVDIA